jgi:uncharacterized 2Fe-2S/4Fe-4S cluster protein (DUF4445 family)
MEMIGSVPFGYWMSRRRMAKKKDKKSRQRKKRKALANRAKSLKKKGTAWLNVLPFDQWFNVPKNTTVLKALQKADIDLDSDCGGTGKCGKCKVRILTSTRLPSTEDSADLLSTEEIDQGIRLACRTKIRKDLAIYIGESEPDLDYFQILKAGSVPIVGLDPPVNLRELQFGPKDRLDSRSTMDLLRASLGSEYLHSEPTPSLLQELPGKRSNETLAGTAVIHRQANKTTLLAWKTGKPSAQYGLVFDLGTSTLVAKLINLADGRQEAAVSCLNSQSKYGADVISRIQHVEQNKEGLQRLHLLLLNNLNNLIKRILKVADLQPSDIFVAVAAGNTTMQHFLLRIDPTGIARAPFSAVLTESLVAKACDVGLMLHPEAVLYLMPSQSAYIGGDMLGFIIASEAAEQDDAVVLGLDLGTNGEIFLGNRKRLLSCSAAAGPAFEGAGISSGSIAKAGAIEWVRFQDGQLHYKDIGNISPISICGSGLVDLTAVLLDCGIIDGTGRFGVPSGDGLASLRERVIPREGGYDFLVASSAESYHHRPIYLTQKDVRELQAAKAAIAAGIEILAKEWGIAPHQVDYIYLAGALGNYINPHSGMRIGLLPMMDPERIISIGNAASAGAAMVLLSRSHWRKAQSLADSIEHVELSTRPDFPERFIANMCFPDERIGDKED